MNSICVPGTYLYTFPGAYASVLQSVVPLKGGLAGTRSTAVGMKKKEPTSNLPPRS